MSDPVSGSERTIHVKDIDPRHRHAIIFQLFEHLAAGATLQLVVDHNPASLRFQLDAKYGARCLWTYLEKGPDAWRVRLQQVRASNTHG